MEGNTELQQVLGQLEAQYDARHKKDAEPPLPLSPEVERFLQELDQRGDEDSGESSE